MKRMYFIVALLMGMMLMSQTSDAQSFKDVWKAAKEIHKNSRKPITRTTSTTSTASAVTNATTSTNATAASTASDDEVSLVVSANGADKDEAIKVALRSAIEQAYGTFVSANTSILNDEMVKDEIVTISSGNIKNYKEIGGYMLSDGRYFVSLQATVCVSKLISYAQSKGAETEFAGATFVMNLKMKELNKKNEEKAIDNLFTMVLAMYPSVFSYQLTVSEPYLTNNDDYYGCTFTVDFIENEKMLDRMERFIFRTLNSLALTEDEIDEYQRQNIPCARICYGPLEFSEYVPSWRLRSNYGDLIDKLNRYFIRKVLNFSIIDNTGKVSEPKWVFTQEGWRETIRGYEHETDAFKIKGGSGIFSNLENNKRKGKEGRIEYLAHCNYYIDPLFYGAWKQSSLIRAIKYSPWVKKISFSILIPKDEIMNYSSFEIKSKDGLANIDIINAEGEKILDENKNWSNE